MYKLRFYWFLLLFCANHINLYSIEISRQILLQLNQKSSVPAILVLKQQAKFDQISESWSKEQKTAFVFQSLKQTAEQSQKNIQAFLRSKNIGFRSNIIVNSISLDLDNNLLNELKSFDELASIHYDENLRVPNTFTDNNLSIQKRGQEITWGNMSIKADQVWSLGYQGQGVTVAGEDTGYKWDIDGIKSSYRGWNGISENHNYNWHDAIHKIHPLSQDSINPCGLNLTVPCDDHGHGTHTAGTMVGQNQDHAHGVAPKAKWIGCRNMERGYGTPSSYIECFDFFLAPTDLNNENPKPELAPHVINNSWYCSNEEGCDTFNLALMEQAISNLKSAGIVVVVSAGNSGNQCGTIAYPPAMFSTSFTIGSYASNDTISGFSSIGPVYRDSSLRIKPNVVAPGSEVLSQLPDGSFQAWNGTSMAAPHVAGLVALMISANPELSGNVKKIEHIIESSARFMPSTVECSGLDPNARPNIMYGYGKIDALSAVKQSLAVVNSKDVLSSKGIEIYPNPGNAVLNINSNQILGQIKIFNFYGQIKTSLFSNENSVKISTQNWSPGFYIIELTNGKKYAWLKN